MKNSKNITPFLQTRPTTCGVACIMMVLNHYQNAPLTSKEEGRLRKKLKLNRFDIVPVISLASYLKDKGLLVQVRHDDPQKFWKKMDSEFPEDFSAQMRKRHSTASNQGIKIERGAIETTEILNALNARKLILLGTETTEGIKHAILLHNADGNTVSYVDPLYGELRASIDEIMLRARMDVGTWFISISEK